MTPSEELIKRYAQIERVSDSFGRVIGVKRLRPSQQVKVQEMTAGLEDRAPIVFASMVCEIDGVMIPFPRSRGELDSMLDRLDLEGLKAIAQAATKLFPQIENDGEPESALDSAKK